MRVVALVVLAGCDLVWGVNAKHGIDAGIDGTPIDAPPDVLTCITFDEASDGDVILFPSTPSVGHPTEGVINAGVAVQSQGLIRYLAPSLQPGQHITAVTFTAPYVASSHSCGSATLCGSCASIVNNGRIDVEYATSQWDEATACYSKPTASGTWQLPGALGAMDRSPPIGGTQYVKATNMSIALDPNVIGSWIQNGKVSLIVTPSVGAVAIIPQRDYTVIDASCSSTQALTKLTFTVCQ